MIVFADAGPSAANLGSQVQAVAFWISIAANLALVVALFIRPKISPQPLDVRSVEDPVPAKECRARHASIDAQLVELRQQRVTDAKDAAFSRKAVYGEIESVRKEMGEMERRLNAADEQRTTALHNRLNDILLAVGELRGKGKI